LAQTGVGPLGRAGAVGALAIGDRVRANVEELADWLYVAGDEPVGGFSIRTLAERLKKEGGEGADDAG